MSWLVNSLQSEGFNSPTSSPDDHTPTNRSGGVRDDLSVLGETIGRQLRGVAAFLAPPPSVSAAQREEDKEEEGGGGGGGGEQPSAKLAGIRNDLAEIGGSFKSGLSLLSSNKAVTDISRFASSFLQFPSGDDRGDHYDEDDEEEEEEDDDDRVPGITEDVVEFVREISNRPEFWTDFPLSLNNDFKMTEVQREHAENIEHLVLSFEALKVNLQHHMGDERFWMIYFILLLPRLSEHDFELLSTPEVVETRDVLLLKLQDNKNARIEKSSSRNASEESSKISEQRRGNVFSEVSEIVNAAEELKKASEENADQWLEDADISSGSSTSARKKFEQEEDVSFSDLEDEDIYPFNTVSASKSTQDAKVSSPSCSNDWVQLNKRAETRGGLKKPGQSSSRDKDSEGGESNDWLTDDDFVDVASGNR